MRSSYMENNYGSVLKALVFAHKPKISVECGILDGYSLVNIGEALKFNGDGILLAYDLWDFYDYKHGDYNKVANIILENNIEEYVNLYKGDAFEVYKIFSNKSINLLHMDISNHGEILINTLEKWGPKISDDGIIVFEGGSIDRDNVEWMKKYNFRPITDVLYNESIVYDNWNFYVLEPFPSITLFCRK